MIAELVSWVVQGLVELIFDRGEFHVSKRRLRRRYRRFIRTDDARPTDACLARLSRDERAVVRDAFARSRQVGDVPRPAARRARAALRRAERFVGAYDLATRVEEGERPATLADALAGAGIDDHPLYREALDDDVPSNEVVTWLAERGHERAWVA